MEQEYSFFKKNVGGKYQNQLKMDIIFEILKALHKKNNVPEKWLNKQNKTTDKNTKTIQIKNFKFYRTKKWLKKRTPLCVIIKRRKVRKQKVSKQKKIKGKVIIKKKLKINLQKGKRIKKKMFVINHRLKKRLKKGMKSKITRVIKKKRRYNCSFAQEFLQRLQFKKINKNSKTKKNNN